MACEDERALRDQAAEALQTDLDTAQALTIDILALDLAIATLQSQKMDKESALSILEGTDIPAKTTVLMLAQEALDACEAANP